MCLSRYWDAGYTPSWLTFSFRTRVSPQSALLSPAHRRPVGQWPRVPGPHWPGFLYQGCADTPDAVPARGPPRRAEPWFRQAEPDWFAARQQPLIYLVPPRSVI